MPPPQTLPALPASPQPHYHHHHQVELQTFLPLVPAARSGVAPHLALPYHAVPPNAAMARRACGCDGARRRGELSRRGSAHWIELGRRASSKTRALTASRPGEPGSVARLLAQVP
jgi:hypothetical protein